VFGSNGTDLNESRDYLADCAELLSEAFAAKVASDYDAKSGEFESLFRSERVIRAGLEKFESAKHAANTISQKDKGGVA
jgi:hypothetical protein